MLLESTDPPDRRPWMTLPNGILVRWVSTNYSDIDARLAPGGSWYTTVADRVAEIPSAIWTAFNRPLTAESYMPQFKFENGYALMNALRPVSITYSGLYERELPSRKSAIISVDMNSGTTFAHELGHHIDATHSILWAGGTAQIDLTMSEPFMSLWAAASPTIPSPLYGATNIQEWFAELWSCQLFTTYRGMSAVTFLYQLAGNNSQARADAIRAAFAAILPMPAWGGYPAS